MQGPANDVECSNASRGSTKDRILPSCLRRKTLNPVAHLEKREGLFISLPPHTSSDNLIIAPSLGLLVSILIRILFDDVLPPITFSAYRIRSKDSTHT